MAPLRSPSARLLCLLAGMCIVGCASTPYQYGRFSTAESADTTPAHVTIEYGQPQKTLDRLAKIVALPSKILPMHPGVNSHSLSDASADKLTRYLEENDLADVRVCVNQYDPRGEWQRLRENELISPGWKYSIGTLGWVVYTALPGRVFGGDLYNPYTNSLHINSDVSAVILAEAAYAKDIHTRKLPGPYATVNELPLLSMWRHVHAVNDVLSYAQTEEDWDLERETYRVVYPQMGIHAAGGGQAAASFLVALPVFTVPLVALGGAAAGHAVGQTSIAQREAAWRKQLPPTEAVESEIELTGHEEPAETDR